MKKVAILANGGDVAGFNAVIRGIMRTAQTHGVETYGFIEGYKGLVENNYIRLDNNPIASGILPKGGSIIGSSTNTIVFHYKVVHEDGTVTYEDMSDRCVQNIKDDGFECLFTLGGDSTQKSARDLFIKGINTIGVPKTIDNDLYGTDMTFGFQSAVDLATSVIDCIHTTAASHGRVFVIEVMGHKVGYLTLNAGMAGGADIILIPEIPFDIDKIAKKVEQRLKDGNRFTIIAVAEGAISKEDAKLSKKEYQKKLANRKHPSVSYEVADLIQQKTGQEVRVTVPGHMQRGGSPCPYDRVFASRLGVEAGQLILNKEYGFMVAYKNREIVKVPLSEIAGKLKYVSPDASIIKEAKMLGVCFGD